MLKIIIKILAFLINLISLKKRFYFLKRNIMNDIYKNAFVRCGLAGLVAAIISFIEHKMDKEIEFKPDYSRYIKIFLLVTSLSYGVLIIGYPVSTQKDVGDSNSWTEKTVQTSEQIHTGNPNF
tara:strand:- start:1561 stop:1929 length:369 start_codon:yes stop_codon:yes gene_type:complete